MSIAPRSPGLSILWLLGPLTLGTANAAPAVSRAAAPPPDPIAIEVTLESATKWSVRLRNAGSTALRVPVDSRLIAFELRGQAPSKVAGRAGAVTSTLCDFPADMRPEQAEVGTLAIEPGKSVWLDVDPRLYCFSTKQATALEGATQLSARYNLFGGPSRVLKSEPVEVPAAAKAPLRPGPEEDEEEDEDEVVIGIEPRIDGTRATTTQVRVTVKNNGERARRTFLRAGNVGFLVEGPSGAFTCLVKGTPPIRELESTLLPRGKASVDVLLGPTCAGRTFDRPGLYVVRPLFAPKKPAWDQGQSLFGQHRGAPALIRLHRGARPFAASPPRLD